MTIYHFSPITLVRCKKKINKNKFLPRSKQNSQNLHRVLNKFLRIVTAKRAYLIWTIFHRPRTQQTIINSGILSAKKNCDINQILIVGRNSLYDFLD